MEAREPTMAAASMGVHDCGVAEERFSEESSRFVFHGLFHGKLHADPRHHEQRE
jgi:hypothetical protein